MIRKLTLTRKLKWTILFRTSNMSISSIDSLQKPLISSSLSSSIKISESLRKFVFNKLLISLQSIMKDNDILCNVIVDHLMHLLLSCSNYNYDNAIFMNTGLTVSKAIKVLDKKFHNYYDIISFYKDNCNNINGDSSTDMCCHGIDNNNVHTIRIKIDEILCYYDNYILNNKNIFDDINLHHNNIKHYQQWNDIIHIDNRTSLQIYGNAAYEMGQKQWVKDSHKWMESFMINYFRYGGARKYFLKQIRKNSSFNRRDKYVDYDALMNSLVVDLKEKPSVIVENLINSDDSKSDYHNTNKVEDNIHHHHNSSLIKILDVGSCYNPFQYSINNELFEITALDLHPTDPTVYQCDFLNLHVSSSDSDRIVLAIPPINHNEDSCDINNKLNNECHCNNNFINNNSIDIDVYHDDDDIKLGRNTSYLDDNNHNKNLNNHKDKGINSTIASMEHKDKKQRISYTKKTQHISSAPIGIDDNIGVAVVVGDDHDHCDAYHKYQLFQLPSSSFDVITMSLVLSYLPTPNLREAMIKKARQLLMASTYHQYHRHHGDHHNYQHHYQQNHPHYTGLLFIVEKQSIFNQSGTKNQQQTKQHHQQQHRSSKQNKKKKSVINRDDNNDININHNDHENYSEENRDNNHDDRDKNNNTLYSIPIWIEVIERIGFHLIKYENYRCSDNRKSHIFVFATTVVSCNDNDNINEYPVVDDNDDDIRRMKLFIKQDFEND